MCQVVAYERLKTMNKLYNCHLKEWLQWLTRSSNYRSSLTVNILAFGTGGCRWRLDCINVCDNFFSGNSLSYNEARLDGNKSLLA